MPITHRDPLTPPTPPTLGAAGSLFTDPTFGSRMVRVTDADWGVPFGSSGISFHSSAAGYQREWNADGTKFWIASSDGWIYLVSFNPVTMATAKIGQGLLLTGDVAWSDTDPNILYGVTNVSPNRTLVKMDCATVPPTKTTIVNLDDIISGLTGNVGTVAFANGILFCICGGIQETHHYAVWYPIADPGSVKILDTQASGIMPSFFGLHSAQMDMSGRVSSMIKSGGGTYFWDTTLNTVTQSGGFDSGHEVLGFMTRINNDTLNGSYDSRNWVFTQNLADPNNTKVKLPTPGANPLSVVVGGWGAEHASWANSTAANPLVPFVSGTYRYGDGPGYANSGPGGNDSITRVLDHTPDSPSTLTPLRAWDDEIVSVATNGTNTVWRHCHTQSLLMRNVTLYEPSAGSDIFWYTPRPNVSRDGRWAVFSSNWGKTLGTATGTGIRRVDVFLVELFSGQRAHRRKGRFH